MPRLVLTSPRQATARNIPIKKKILTFGKGQACDVVIDDSTLLDVHANLVQEPGGYVISALDTKATLSVNGKTTRSHRLRPEDQIAMGQARLVFHMDDLPEPKPAETQRLSPADLFPRLVLFSERLMADHTPEVLFRVLLDQVIDATGADKGFLVLVGPNGETTIPVSRNIARSDMSDPTTHLSDSILARAMDTGEAIIVSDAVHDDRFNNSRSVVDFKLSSVMCAPLRFRGKLLGCLYLGNDRVAGLFRPSDLELLKIYAGQAAVILHNAQLVNELAVDNLNLREELKRTSMGRIIGQSDAMQKIFRTIERVARTDIGVLVQGETGTGKELIAQEIHARSSRQSGPFVSINCGAIPENLLESELFGHVKGAFTGAITHRVGRFEAANGGTLFLDEIGEMPMPLQVKLLRVLQERHIERLGEGKARPVDIRVVAATNRNLEKMVSERTFREDLYYRLNEVLIQVPPLRDRDEDVVLLGRYYLDRMLSRYPDSRVKGFSKDAITAMTRYIWPGNVRQLENKLKKAVVMGDKNLLSAEDLEIRLDRQNVKISSLKDAQDEFSLNYVRDVLEANNWNKTQTARDLDVDPRTIFRYAERLLEVYPDIRARMEEGG